MSPVPRKQPTHQQPETPATPAVTEPAPATPAPTVPATRRGTISSAAASRTTTPHRPDPRPDPSPGPDAARRSERARRAIYAAALFLVAEQGYRKITVEGIAARAGVGKQTIYRWWSSKAEVLLEAFLDLGRQAEEAAGGRATASSAFPDTGDLAADLRCVLRATVDELQNPVFEPPARALAAEGLVNERLGAEFVAKLLEPQLRRYAERLQAARDSGALRADLDPRIALELFVSPLAQRWLQRTGPLSHAYADTLVDYALHGLLPR